MRLPGIRHRTLAPSSIAGKHDLDAIDTAVAEIKRGGYAPIPWTMPLTPCALGNWTLQAGNSYAQAAAGGDDLYLAWQATVGEYLRAFEVMVYANGANPVTLRLERVTPGDVTVFESIFEEARTTAATAWIPKTINLIDAGAGRPVGVEVRGEIDYIRLKVTAGQAGDRFAPVYMIKGLPQALPAAPP